MAAKPLSWLMVVLFCCCMAAPSVRAENRCAGGGKPRPDEGGIGGTGARPGAPEEDDSGIGGTGLTAEGDIGIIGTITGFASICVGGVEIHYDARSIVEVDGQPATVATLAIGQVVEVVASGTGDEVTARQISVHHIVAGPVTALDPERGTLEVMGQVVRLPDTQAYEVGQFVRVSGLRRGDGSIAASLIAREEGDVVLLSGPIARVDPGALTVGETRVAIASDTAIAGGEEARIVGRWDGSQIVANSVQAQPRVPFGGRVPRVEVEGFATVGEAGRVRLGTYVFEGTAPPESPLAPDARVRVRAVIQDQRAVIERIGPVADRPPRPQQVEPGRPRSEANPDGIPQLGVDPVGRDMDGPSRGRPESGAPAKEGRPPVDPPDGARPPRPERPEMQGRPAGPEAMRPERPPRVERPEPPQRPDLPERPPRP